VIQVAVSAAATAVALGLLALAARRLYAVLRSGPANIALPPRRLPALLAGWIGLVAFAAGMYLGRTFWQ
jgi:hypothetical protein